jgi:hypothetical protein
MTTEEFENYHTISLSTKTKGDTEGSIQKFKKLYFDTVDKAKKLFYGKYKEERKKYRNLPSTLYWKLGHILLEFTDRIQDEFVITNYAQALERDFGLSRGYVHELLVFVNVFKRNEVLDSIPVSYYRMLMRKRTQLQRWGIFEKEKMRLIRMGKENKLIGREKYKRELAQTIEILVKKKK